MAESLRPGAKANKLQFVGQAGELPPVDEPAGPSVVSPSAPDGPRPAPADENIQPGVPQPLPPAEQAKQQDEQALTTAETQLPAIRSLTVDIQPSAGELPANTAAAVFARQPTILVPPPEPVPEWKYTGWPRISGICNHPLYFEEAAAERYGITGPLQPLCSFAHFFGTIPVLPIKVALHPPRELVCNEHYYPAPTRPWLRSHPVVRRMVAAGESASFTAIFLMP